jgi:hypothetical protein
MRFMTATRTQFLSSALLALVALPSVPSAVLAYNGYTMQSDQRDINNLVQEGVLNPMQAQALDNRTVNRQYGGFFNNMFTGGGMIGPATNPLAGMQSSGQIRREDRQLDKLERDGIISRRQEKGMEQQLWQEHNAVRNGFVPTTGYMPTAGFVPSMVAAPGVFTSMVAASPVVAPPMVQPLAQEGLCHHAAWMANHGLLNNVTQYNPGYYTTSASGTLLNRVSNYWH